MKRYRNPSVAIPSEPKLPLLERILCAITIGILVVGAVYLSVHWGP